jgi:hypothetical protein
MRLFFFKKNHHVFLSSFNIGLIQVFDWVTQVNFLLYFFCEIQTSLNSEQASPSFIIVIYGGVRWCFKKMYSVFGNVVCAMFF